MSAQSRPESETTLAAFQTTPTPEPKPDPADDYDGLQALAASVSSGFTTTQAREDRSHDRVVETATCSVCGQSHDDAGVCPVREANGELADDRVRAIGGGGN